VDRIRFVRDLVAQEFETITSRSFVPRTTRALWLSGEPLPEYDVHSFTVFDSAGGQVEAVESEVIGPFTLAYTLLMASTRSNLTMAFGR
jgi:hypothetical protein